MTRTTHTVLVVEDEKGIRDILRVLLEKEGYNVIEAETLEYGHTQARSHKPDLLLLDLGLPDGDGAGLIRKVRLWSGVPIVVLTARTMEEQKIAALDAGADDYITKPFSAPELLARVRAGLRRNSLGQQSPRLKLGRLNVDLSRRMVTGAEGVIHLTPLEFRILECLARQSGMVVRQSQLLREVWGPGHEDDSRGLRVSIKSLRDKLEPDPRRPRYVLTETGVGYRLLTDESFSVSS